MNFFRSRHFAPRAFCVAALLAACTVRSFPSRAVAAPLEASFFTSKTAPEGAIWMETLEVENITQGYGAARAGLSVDGRPLTVQKVVYPHGIGTRARSQAIIDLKGNATRFVTLLSLDDSVGKSGSVVLRLTVDGVVKFDSGVVRGGEAPKVVDVDLRGATRLLLEVQEVENEINDTVDLLGAAFYLTPKALKDPILQPTILSPRAAALPIWYPAPDVPEINGPRLVGVSPGKPFLFRVPATGKAPLQFEATGLPPGLALDSQTGIITGRVAQAGSYKATVRVKNAVGTDSEPLSIEVGEGKMLLTPVLGWNASTIFGELVTAKMVAEQADYMISSGLAARGWNTIVVDDTWQSRREPDGSLGSNRRFGSIKSLAAYVHSLGLKFGLLSGATPLTPSGYAGSDGFEERDAKLYASWGVDMVKYDWGAESGRKEGTTREQVVAAYKKMREALNKTDRDIALHVVNYGFGGPGAGIGPASGAQLWTTTDALIDTWASLDRATFNQHNNFGFAKPGAWNDFGQLKIGRFTPRNPRFSFLTPAQQRLQVTAWVVGQSAMFLSADMGQLDPSGYYRLATPLLMNPEVLAIHQDASGKQAQRVVAPQGPVELDAEGKPKPRPEPPVHVWKRELADGRIAVAFLNRSSNRHPGEVSWADLGITGQKRVRDAWARQDAGQISDKYTAEVPGHGAVLVVIGP
ncbi:MAG TPA: NPCBM/NEW2 domain-containing protein [Abditibacteriaceae bacterium]|jgi:alpha-galactosidase